MVNDQPLCCPKYCSKCLSMDHCIECDPYFELKSYGTSVICQRVIFSTDQNYNSSSSDCGSGYYSESITNTCENCNFPNCDYCIGFMQCLNCSDRFFMINVSAVYVGSLTSLAEIEPSCLPCVPNCTQCTKFNECDACQIGHFYYLNQCLNCSLDYCYNCTDANTCVGCLDGSYLNKSMCTLCSDLVDQCYECNISPTNNSEVICNSCLFGYYLNGDFCI